MYHLLEHITLFILDICKTVSEYDQDMPQSNTTREEKSKNDNSNITFRTTKVNLCLFPSELIAKLERAQHTAKQNKGLTPNPH